ncbi:MAG: cell division protein ZapE [Betaproteobacteria bacterium]|nr:cell division protein ZapE [Betaproteobacteria bacterium]
MSEIDDLQAAEGEKLSVSKLYERALERRGYISDCSQLAAVGRLQQLFEEWTGYKERRRNALRRLVVRPPLPRGVYLWGGVGRGKSFLMDSFYLSLPLVRKRRVHFHHFMRDVHRELEELKGREDPLSAMALRIAKRYRLICFDEMHVNDIADAMIVGRLLGRTMDLGVVYCMTSNYHPDELYKNGLKRENFMPTIALIKQRLDVLNVDSGVDYRQRTLEKVRVYHQPLSPGAERAMMDAFAAIAEVEEESHELDVEGRIIPYRHRAGGVLWLDFGVICGWGRSQHDYLDLSRRFHTILVSDVPRMGLELSEEARRFTLMVDVFYDNRVKLVLSAAAPPEGLLRIEDAPKDARIRAMVFEFDRTASRLTEMQSREYLALQRRISPDGADSPPVSAGAPVRAE